MLAASLPSINMSENILEIVLKDSHSGKTHDTSYTVLSTIFIKMESTVPVPTDLFVSNLSKRHMHSWFLRLFQLLVGSTCCLIDLVYRRIKSMSLRYRLSPQNLTLHFSRKLQKSTSYFLPFNKLLENMVVQRRQKKK